MSNNKDIDIDARELLEVLVSLMGADAAFWVVKTGQEEKDEGENYRLYPMSFYDRDESIRWDYDSWRLKDSFYTNKVYAIDEEIVSPIIPLYHINKNFGERKFLKGFSLSVFGIADSKKNEKIGGGHDGARMKNSIVSSITFLYNEQSQLRSSEKEFRIKNQEYGRLLLLLKNEIDNYVNKYLIQERVFDIWVEKHLSSHRFEKIYANSAHVFNSVYKEMEEFEGFNEETVKRLSKTWFFLSNETISFLYSTIERNPKHFLDLHEFYVVDKNNTLGQTFSNTFINIMSALLESRWKAQKDNAQNVIYINGQTLAKFIISDNLKDVKIHCNKHLIRTFIAQCLHNSLSPIGNHGHRYGNEIKKVDIFLSESEIVIKDTCLIKIPHPVKVEQARLFQLKKPYIKNLVCDEYSSTTLTSLQGFVDYMHFSCEYGFNKESNFEVSIKFNY